jgi:DNA-binding NarL/FixJ family response regulator
MTNLIDDDFLRWVERPSDRELTVLNLLSLGLKVDEIAKFLCIKVATVRNHTSSLHLKLGASTSLTAFLIAQLKSYITSDDIEAMRLRVKKWRSDGKY